MKTVTQMYDNAKKIIKGVIQDKDTQNKIIDGVITTFCKIVIDIIVNSIESFIMELRTTFKLYFEKLSIGGHVDEILGNTMYNMKKYYDRGYFEDIISGTKSLITYASYIPIPTKLMPLYDLYITNRPNINTGGSKKPRINKKLLP